MDMQHHHLEEYSFFCQFCLEKTPWQQLGSGIAGGQMYMNFMPANITAQDRDIMVKRFENTAMCKRCGVIGSNYTSDCPNLLRIESDDKKEAEVQRCKAKDSYLFNLEFSRPKMTKQGLSVAYHSSDDTPEESKYRLQCYDCCFGQLIARKIQNKLVIPPHRYALESNSLSVSKTYCLWCQGTTLWRDYTVRTSEIDPVRQELRFEIDENYESIGLDYHVISKCSGVIAGDENSDCKNTKSSSLPLSLTEGCKSFKTVLKKETKCQVQTCSEMTKEVCFRNDDFAKCPKCYEQEFENHLLKQSVDRQVELMKENQSEIKEEKEKQRILADNYSYYCAFCCDRTIWKKSKASADFSVCSKCNAEGSIQLQDCERCLDRQVHAFKHKVNKKEKLWCAKCVMGIGPKDVTDVSVMNCIFCPIKTQTFYHFATQLMCQGCNNTRTNVGPHGAENEQFCNVCKKEKPELWTKKNLSQCRQCWLDTMEIQNMQQQAQIFHLDTDIAAEEEEYRPQFPPAEGKGKIFKYECLFCGKEDQLWEDLGGGESGQSRCLGCKIIGTNSWEETCAFCQQQDYIFTIDKLSKCFTCWNKEEA